MAVIDAQALAKRFGHVDAVRAITFAVEAGERLAYIGPNGAGKSTSIKMLTGILYPSGGSAEVLGLMPWRQRRQLALRIGTLFGQRSQLWFQLSPRETLELLGRVYRLSRAETARRIDELAELLDAAELLGRPVRTLSLGERMRCELAASVLHEPEILFLDEPTIGLDLIAKARFRDLILRLNEERATTIFLTSHDVSDIEQVARRVIVINHGQLIYDDKVSRMRRELLTTRLIDVRFESEPDDLEIEGATVVKLSGPGAKLEVDTERRSIRSVLDDLLDRYDVADISVTEPPLEDVIAHIYGQAPA
jgi:ABC-2 type transport system ATP-binding protein